MYSQSKGADMRQPMPTVTGQAGHIAQVCAFITKYYGTGNGSGLAEPMGTVTSKDRMGLVTIRYKGCSIDFQIVDIGLRMLQPRELARAQGFPDTYILTGTKTSQVARIGNSVCPDVAEALVRANFPSAREQRVAA
jgi:DNA (cytosine-5)-methyltransferase 1